MYMKVREEELKYLYPIPPGGTDNVDSVRKKKAPVGSGLFPRKLMDITHLVLDAHSE